MHGVTFWALSTMGFNVEGENAVETLTSFRWLMGALPVLSGLGVVLILWQFPIDAKRQRELRNELENQKLAPAVDRVPIKEATQSRCLAS